MKQPNEYVENRLKYDSDFEQWSINHFIIIDLIFGDKSVLTGFPPYADPMMNSREFKQYKVRKNTNFDRLTEIRYFGIYVFNENRFEYQMYLVTKKVNKSTFKEEFEFQLFNFISYADDEVVEIGSMAPGCYKYGMNPMQGQGWYRSFEDYDIDFDRLYECSPFKGIKFGDYSFYWEQAYLERRMLRLCCKQGAFKFAKSIARNEVDWRVVTDNRIKKYRNIIARYDYSYEDFKLLLDLEKLKFNVVQKAIPLMASLDYMQALNNQADFNFDWDKMQMYLIYQNKTLKYYLDYISMLKQLKVKSRSNKIIYPENLRKSHDDLVLRLEKNKLNEKLKKEKKIQAKYEKRLELISKFEYVSANGYFRVNVPMNLSEIVEEGTKLQHCVKNYSYVEGHSKGEFNILFVRLKTDPNEPLYTFTLENDLRITQFHGYRNQDRENAMHEVIRKFLFDEYLPWVKAGCKQQKQKKERAHPSQQMVMQG